MYCAFVDLKKAFDTVDHKLLYNKLYHLGLSSKIINIIRQIYDNVYLTLEMNGNKYNSVKINRRVLQTDSLKVLFPRCDFHDDRTSGIVVQEKGEYKRQSLRFIC